MGVGHLKKKKKNLHAPLKIPAESAPDLNTSTGAVPWTRGATDVLTSLAESGPNGGPKVPPDSHLPSASPASPPRHPAGYSTGPRKQHLAPSGPRGGVRGAFVCLAQPFPALGTMGGTGMWECVWKSRAGITESQDELIARF